MNFSLIKGSTKEPLPDIGVCFSCGRRTPLLACDLVTDGCWESGYYEVYVCPNCPDAGCIDEYDFSPEQWRKHKRWLLEQKENINGI